MSNEPEGNTLKAQQTERRDPSILRTFFRQILSHRELLLGFVQRDLTSRYKGTFMGLFWNVINPLAMLALYTFVFSVIMRMRFSENATTGNYALYLFCGLVPWMAFSETVDKSTGLILKHQNLVKRTVFPLEVLPCYLSVSNLVTECANLAILLLAVLVAVKHLTVHLAFLPLLLVLQLLFALGFAFFFSSICVFFRDVVHFVTLMLLAWFFATPIIYPETLYPERLKFLLWLNPIALLVGMFRDVVLEGTSPAPLRLLAFSAWTVIAFWAGLFFFNKTKREFADVI